MIAARTVGPVRFETTGLAMNRRDGARRVDRVAVRAGWWRHAARALASGAWLPLCACGWPAVEPLLRYPVECRCPCYTLRRALLPCNRQKVHASEGMHQHACAICIESRAESANSGTALAAFGCASLAIAARPVCAQMQPPCESSKQLEGTKKEKDMQELTAHIGARRSGVSDAAAGRSNNGNRVHWHGRLPLTAPGRAA